MPTAVTESQGDGSVSKMLVMHPQDQSSELQTPKKLHVVSAYRAHIPTARWVLETEELPEAPKPCSLADTVTHEKRLLLEHVETST